MDIFEMMFPGGDFDQYEDYGYLMGSPANYNFMPGLDQMDWLAPLMDTVLNRGMFNERGGYQDPYQPHYHALRHIQNVLGKDWPMVLGLMGDDAPAPVRGTNPYEFEFAGNSLLSEYLAAMINGEYSPTTAVTSLKNEFEDLKNDPDLQLAMRSQLPMTSDGQAVDWGAVRNLFSNFMTEESKLDEQYGQALAEYESRPQYGFEERDLTAEKRMAEAEDSADRILEMRSKQQQPSRAVQPREEVPPPSGIDRAAGIADLVGTIASAANPGGLAGRAAGKALKPVQELADDNRGALDALNVALSLPSPGALVGKLLGRAAKPLQEKATEAVKEKLRPAKKAAAEPKTDNRYAPRPRPQETREQIIKRLTTEDPSLARFAQKHGMSKRKTTTPRRDTAAALERAVMMSRLAQGIGR